VDGPEDASTLVLSWGGTFGACAEGARAARARGIRVAHAHLRHLNPLPANLGQVLAAHERVLIPELNSGQLAMLVRAEYLVKTHGLNKLEGRPFSTSEVLERIVELDRAGDSS